MRTYPDDMTDDMRFILGLPNFQTGPWAHALRAGGEPIPEKMEEEQAFVLHWLLKLCMDHPDDWRARAQDALRAGFAAKMEQEAAKIKKPVVADA